MLFSLFVILCTITLGRSVSNVCPSKEEIRPCVCRLEDRKPWIFCAGISSLNQLKKAVEALEDYKLESFYLKDSNIGVLPSKLFEDVEIEDLDIWFTNLTSLSEGLNTPPFVGLENSLRALDIRESFTNEDYPLTRLSLSHLKKLVFLKLEGNRMPIIGNDWFESGPYHLRELYLLDTSTEKVGSHAFLFLSELRKISITGGSFSSVSRNMFPIPAIYLEALDLSNNQIETLPNNMFTKMPSLNEIYLQNNALKSIDEIAFSQAWSQLHSALFEGNPLNCDKEMKWIFKYRLPESFQGQCATPAALNGRSLKNLTLLDFEQK